MREDRPQTYGEAAEARPSNAEALMVLKNELASYERIPNRYEQLGLYIDRFREAIVALESGRANEAVNWLSSEKAELEEYLAELKEGLERPTSAQDFSENIRAGFKRELEESERLLHAINVFLEGGKPKD